MKDIKRRRKIYIGLRGPIAGEKAEVSVVDGDTLRPLSPRMDLKNYSEDGIDWGIGNGAPAQLALAVLADATGSDAYALRHHHWFNRDVVKSLPWKRWRLTEAEIMAWVRNHHPLDK